MKLLTRAAQAFSILFHPLFIPVYGLLVIFNSGSYVEFLSYEYKKPIFLLVVVNTVAIPLALMPIYLYNKVTRSDTFGLVPSRIVPMIILLFLYLITFYLLIRVEVNGFQVPYVIRTFILASALTTLLSMLITLLFNISLYMVGLGGLLGCIMGVMYRLDVVLINYIAFTLLASGVVATSRLLLEKHRPLEVYAGFFLGAAVVFFSFLFLIGN
jgi:hypothetical protein